MKNFINISDHLSNDLRAIIDEAKSRKLKRKGFNKSAPDEDKPFDGKSLADLLVCLSRLPVFDKEFANSFNHDLDILAIVKKLKYYNNLPLAQNLQLLQQLLARYGVENKTYNGSYFHLVRKAGEFAATRFNYYVQENAMEMMYGALYKNNTYSLEKIDPHAIYPTSIYRHCDGLTLASKDSKSIEAVMSTTLTTSIKITKNVLDLENKNLINKF